jgi:hypothetical protein
MTITQTLPTSSVKQTLETSGGQAFELTPIPLPKIDLRDAHAIRRELGAVYRDVRAGRVQTQHGTRLAYVLDMIGKAYQSAVLQERIDHLERTLDYRRGQP